jgi:outer membrane beta-barrel protein
MQTRRTLAVLALVIGASGVAAADDAKDPSTGLRAGRADAEAEARADNPDEKDGKENDKDKGDDRDEDLPPRTTQMCIDQEIADRLAVKRKRRGAVDRLFVKQARHELTVNGGYYSSDLFSGTYIAGGSYTYHMTDGTAVEFAGSYTHANADVIRAIEDLRGEALEETFDRVIIAESLLMMSPIYGKLRLGGSIIHFDIHVDLGVGVVDSETSRGAVGVVGFGMKLFGGKAFAFRVDARNRTYRQELLDERFLVNDSAITAGLSVFLPFSN